MAECVENGVLDPRDTTDTAADKSALKINSQQDEQPKQNGVKCEGDNQASDHNNHDMDWSPSETAAGGNKNGAADDAPTADVENDSVKVNGSGDNLSNNENSNISDISEKSSINEGENSRNSFKEEASVAEGENESVDKSEAVSEKDADDSEKDADDSNSAVSVNTNDPSPTEDSSEAMEVGEDSNDVNINTNSNASAPTSDAVEIEGTTTSQEPSVISEDSSRDSSDSSASGVNLKDEEGGDILITLNNELDKDEEDKSDNITATDDLKTEKKESAVDGDKSKAADGEDASATKKTESPNAVDLTLKSPEPQKSTPTTATGVTPPTSTVLIQGNIGQQIPVGAQLLQQGNQLGYVTKIGAQNIFVPVSAQSQQQGKVALMVNQGSPQVAQPNVPINQAILQPQSSMEMIERMHFELQNRIPDNHNWSVAFHPKKDELSSITSFLLELGHDVVKEAVYKDIIKIQTKKKDDHALKDNEVESLEKMKTVYENTKKKVDHLQLKKVDCHGCRFRTESAVVLNHHKDFPHFDPPWDMTKGWMLCARCKYRTRVLAQFSFHMETVHKTQAKLLEKPQLFQCELCPLNTTTKNKLEKHRTKCIKHFKLNVNLQPYYHDVNFSMKTCYYKPKKIIPKPPPPPPVQKPTPSPRPAMPAARPTMQTRQNQPMPPKLQNFGRPQVAPKPSAVRQPPPLQPRQRMPLPRPVTPQQRPGLRAPIRGGSVGQNMTPRPPSVPQQRPVRPPAKEMSGFEVCELCGGYVKDRQALRIHFYYAHKVEMPQAIFSRPVPPLSCDVCQSKFWTTQGLSKHKSTLRHYANQSTVTATTPPAPTTTMQTCFMCSRKVTNLFVHIEQYHGMTMKDLVAMRKCIMCGITAADRRSLETHMASAHGVLIKTNDILGPEKPTASPGAAATTPSPQLKTTPGNKAANAAGMNRPSVKPSPMARNNLCVFCQIQFADNIQLTMHCIKAHATCNACGMVVASNKNLTNHNCKQVKRNCSICGVKNIAPDIYPAHLKTHVKQCNVTLTRMSENEISEIRSKVKKEYKPQIITLDSDEDSDIAVVDSNSDDEVEVGVTRRMGPRSKTRLNHKAKKEQPNGAADKKGTEVKSEQNDTAEVKSETDDKGITKVDDDNDADTTDDPVEKEKESSDIKTEAEVDGETSNKMDGLEESENNEETLKQETVDDEKAQTENVEIKQESSDMDTGMGDEDNVESDKSVEEPDVPVKTECTDKISENEEELPDNGNEVETSDTIDQGDDIPNLDKSPVDTNTDNVGCSDSTGEGDAHAAADESESKQGTKRGLEDSTESGTASDDEQMAKRLKTESENPAEES